MTLKTLLIAAVALGCATAGAVQASTNLIVNGDFSSPNTGAGWSAFNAAQTGWTNAVDGGLVEIGNSAIYGLGCETATCQNLEVNYVNFGDVSQTVSGLVVGETYTLSFAYGVRTSGGPQQLDVNLGGQPQFVLNPTDDGLAPGSWTVFSTNVVATSGMETLEFQSVDVGGLPSYGNEITAVSLVEATAVPEPAQWALMLLGLGGLGLALRSRRAIA